MYIVSQCNSYNYMHSLIRFQLSEHKLGVVREVESISAIDS